MANKYIEIIPTLVEKLGGVENVKAATHCVSRLRLVLNDDKIIDDKYIENMKYVKGIFKVNGQFHIIFGQEVPEVYEAFIDYPGMSEKATTAASIKTIGAEKQSFMKRMMNHISEIFMPLIPLLVAGGLILGIRNILETNWTGDPDNVVSAVAKVPFFSGLNDFLWPIACAVFWFLPVFIVWSIFKKMKGSQVLGILIGLSLLVAMPSTYELNGQIEGGKGVDWSLITDFFTKGSKFNGWDVFPIKVGYTSQVIPAIGVAFAGVYIERFLKVKVTPVLRQIVVPLVTVLASFSLAILVIGPVGFVIGTTISIIISLALTNFIAKYFVAPLFGFFYAPLVLTGLHHTLNAVMAQNTGTLGGSLIFPILAISNIAQGAATLMYGIMNKKDEKAKQVAFPATTSAWLGVTEPAMYGINLKNSYCFLASMIGSAAGATLAVAAGVTSNGIGNGAWLGTITIQAESPVPGVNTWVGTGYTWFLLSAILATALTMSLTFIFSKSNVSLELLFGKFKKSGKSNKTKGTIQNITKAMSIANGKVFSLKDINDEAFKNGVLGQGFAIDAIEGKVFSPINGRVEVIAPTKHAYGIVADDGTSILIHIGVDTVNLDDRKVFEPRVKVGQKVKTGKLLCVFDRDKIIQSNLEQKVIVLITPESTTEIEKMFEGKNITTNDIMFNLKTKNPIAAKIF